MTQKTSIMKAKFTFYFLISIFFLVRSVNAQETDGITIGKDGQPPQINAIMELVSKERGILIPRLTNDEISSIQVQAGAEGLLVYNTTSETFNYYDGNSWNEIGDLGSLEDFVSLEDNKLLFAYKNQARSIDLNHLRSTPVVTDVNTIDNNELYTGNIIYNSTDAFLYCFNGNNWIKLARYTDTTIGSGTFVDWEETDPASSSYIANKPVFSEVATTGSYNDLDNKPDMSNYLTSETDSSITNEGSLSVKEGAGNTSIISSNTSGSTDVTLLAGGNIILNESDNTIIITAINTDNQNALQVEVTAQNGISSANVQSALEELQSEITASGTDDQNLVLTGNVLSIEGGSGSVDLANYIGTDDQTATEVTFDNTFSGLTASNVQAAIDELENEIDVVNTDNQNASQVEVTAQNGISNTNVQSALEELQSEITAAGTDDQNLVLTGNVLSIEGGSGSVDLANYIGTDDQTATEVTFDNTSSGLTASNVQAAIDELENEIDVVNTDNQNASQVEVTAQNGISSTNVQSALEELQSEITAAGTDDQNLVLTGNVLSIEGGSGSVDLANYIGTDDQTATEVTFDNTSSGLTASNVQAAIDELENEIDVVNTDNQNASQIEVTAQNGISSTNVQSALEELQSEITVAGTDDQAISYNNTTHTLTLENGGSVDLSNLLDDTKLTEAEVDNFVSNNGYLTNETDPVFNVSAAASITDAGSGAVITTTERTKLDGIAAGAEVNVNPDWNASSGDAQILNKPSSFTPSAHELDSHSNIIITDNTDGEILRWNGTNWVNNTLAEAGIQSAGASSHDAVTIGTANGLSLTGQQLSLDAASSSTTGALSSTDWTTFNNKQSALTFQNGITENAGTVNLGGDLTANTEIKQDNAETLTFTNSGTGNTVINLSGTGDLDIQDNGNSALFVGDNGNVGIGTSSPGSEIEVKGTIRLSGSSSGYVGIAPANDAGSTTYTLPVADGSSGQVLSTNGSGILSWSSAAAAGTVSSVGLALPSEFSVSGSPVTGSGTLTGAWASQTANTLFAAPNGSDGTPSFRTLTDNDIPSLTASKITDFQTTVNANANVAANTAARHDAVTIGTANGLSLSGQEISLDAATTTTPGALSAADKTKLDGIATGAEVNVNADWDASSGDAQILNKPDLSGYLTSETDGSVTNEGSLTVGAGTATTSLISSNTSGSTDVTISAGSNIALSETGNTITIAATDTDDQTLSEILAVSTSAGTHKITEVTDPTADQDAATKKYVDTQVSGVSAHDAVTIGTANGLSLSGQEISLDAATTTTPGALSAADKTKLDGIATGAEANVNADWDASSGDAQILNKPDLSGYLTSETDGSVTNEGSLTVGAGTATTSLISSNTSGSTDVTISAGSNISLSETDNTITIAATDTDDQTATEVSITDSGDHFSSTDVEGALGELATEIDAKGTGTVTSVSSATTDQITVANGTTTPAISAVTAAVANNGTALATGDQIYNFVTTQGYLTSETDGSVTNEGSLTVGAGTATTSLISSNTSGSTDVTISAGSNISLSETDNTITIAATDTDDQTLSEILAVSTSAGTHKITEVTDPTADQDAATKKYVDTQVSGVSTHDAVTIGIANGLSLSGQEVSLDAATTTTPGALSAADKTKLDGIATGAEVNVNADWDATSGDAQILNKPDLSGYLTSETDGSVTNEGSLTVGAGTATTSLISSNTSGSTDVTISAGSNISLSETDNTITIAATDTDDQTATEVSITDSGDHFSSTDVEGALGELATEIDAKGTGTVTSVSSATTDQITVANGTTTPAISAVTAAVANNGTALATGDQIYNFVTTQGYLTSETDGSVTNEGSLTVGAGTATTSLISSNTSGSTDVTISAGSNISLSETDNTITIAATDTDDQTLSEILAVSTSAGTHKITEVTDPTADQDAATKKYVDTQVSGVSTHDAVTIGIANGLSLSGQEVSLDAATTTTPGALSAADKTKLDGIATGAEVNVNADWDATSGDAQILNKPDLSGYLTSETDGSVTNEGSLTVGAGTATTSLISSNTSGSTDVTISAGSNIALSEAGNTITIAATDTDDQTATEVSITDSGDHFSSTDVEGALGELATEIDAKGTGTVTSVSSATTDQITVANGTTTPAISAVTAAVANNGTALATGDQIYNFVTTQGYLTSETDGSVTNEGSLTVGAGTATTSLISSNTSGSTDVTISAGSNISLSETDNTITIAATDTDDQTLSEILAVSTSAGTHKITEVTDPTADQDAATKKYVDTQVSGVSTHDAVTIGIANGLSLSGQEVSLDAATTTTPGALSAADKTKLDGIATGAEVNVNADWDATSGDAQILNKPDLSGYLTSETDGSVTNEGSLTVGAGTATTSLISSNTSGSTDVTISAGSNIALSEAGNTITIAATDTDDQTLSEILAVSTSAGTHKITEVTDPTADQDAATKKYVDTQVSGVSTHDAVTIGTANGLNLSGQEISLDAATTTTPGALSAADKTKLDGIATGAEVNVNADWDASSGDAQILNKPDLSGYLTSETDGSVTNEGSLTVEAGTATTSLISSNTSGSTDVTISAGSNISLSETDNTITIAATDTDDQTLSEILAVTSAGTHKITEVTDPTADQELQLLKNT